MILTQDIVQWAGISVGSIVNCMNWAMTVLLEQHDKFIFISSAGSLDVELARMFVEARSCTTWRGGFAANGSTINLFEKPSHYGEMFYDRKSQYLLNCQVCVDAAYVLLLHLVAECYGAITVYCNAT